MLPVIPVVHRYWTGPVPKSEPFNGNVANDLHAGLVHDWTDENLNAGTKAWLDDAADQVKPEDVRRHRANMLRWRLLSTFGGVWIDHDVIPLTNLLTVPRPFIAAHGTICTSVIGMDAGDPWADDVLAAIAASPGGASRASPDVSGERVVATVTPPRVVRRALPFDSRGRRLSDDLWAVHTFASSSRKTALV